MINYIYINIELKFCVCVSVILSVFKNNFLCIKIGLWFYINRYFPVIVEKNSSHTNSENLKKVSNKDTINICVGIRIIAQQLIRKNIKISLNYTDVSYLS